MSAPEGGEVHLVDIAIDECMGTDPRLLASLDEAERRRAARFYFARDRAAFVACRAIVRSQLAEYLGCAPASVRLAYGPRGKPCLAPDQLAASGVEFNVSHSGACGLVAFARGRAVGVDIERIRPEVHLEEIGRRFFTESEVRAAHALAPPERVPALFHCWARKEAFVKASGQGFWRSLDSFCVDVNPSAVEIGLTTFGDRSEAASWRLIRIEAACGYVAALAARGCDWSVRRLRPPYLAGRIWA